jgi:hypothetical protein
METIYFFDFSNIKSTSGMPSMERPNEAFISPYLGGSDSIALTGNPMGAQH